MNLKQASVGDAWETTLKPPSRGNQAAWCGVLGGNGVAKFREVTGMFAVRRDRRHPG